MSRGTSVELAAHVLWMTHRFLKVTDMENVQEVFMNRDELDGKTEQVKGKIKQAAGDLTDNESLHQEGVADEAAGDVQEGFGRGRRKVGDAIKDIGDRLKG